MEAESCTVTTNLDGGSIVQCAETGCLYFEVTIHALPFRQGAFFSVGWMESSDDVAAKQETQELVIGQQQGTWSMCVGRSEIWVEGVMDELDAVGIQAGDTIGCWLNVNELVLGFSKNGKHIETATPLKLRPDVQQLIPAATLAKGCKCAFNLGSQPFLFPISNGLAHHMHTHTNKGTHVDAHMHMHMRICACMRTCMRWERCVAEHGTADRSPRWIAQHNDVHHRSARRRRTHVRRAWWQV